MNAPDQLTVALAQIAPVWLNRQAGTEKIVQYIKRAAQQGAQLVCFGETILPGYPFWLDLTEGSRFNDEVQKDLHAYYVAQGVDIEAGDLAPICAVAKELHIAVMLGCLERPQDRTGYSVYCSCVYIDAEGLVQSVHRKLMPTYEERLTWAPGDGHGLRTHALQNFRIGGLNCWENWMPLSRAALYAQGEDVHIGIWPGNLRNTEDLTRFIAKEGRSFSIAVSGLMRRGDFPQDFPHLDLILQRCPEVLANGGSCIAGPDGRWIIEPVVDQECLLVATLDRNEVRRERQNFDVAGHYSRPDITRLIVNRERQALAKFED
ncbi:carbon-nitrogen hydrolase family protein [Undibacterium cyanobacteriorum]|uniref:Carbon-nitrogen hydrolase family protein n=1 Tax=Undibacterium cyanobacteriorum TaxID=3073561 RepID=A0ABY9RDB8_9BURK|nr:carbon-nitrogen hydrolase family protein [Undibacterium sp. 20NA77.5]WMW79237.1 carbon-nitrogen hydrolase family protein [Undibacterium sp. 20NA77.5]